MCVTCAFDAPVVVAIGAVIVMSSGWPVMGKAAGLKERSAMMETSA